MGLRKRLTIASNTWAAEILTNVIRVDNSDMEARRLKAEPTDSSLIPCSTSTWRNWTLTAVAELEGVRSTSQAAWRSPQVMSSRRSRPTSCSKC